MPTSAPKPCTHFGCSAIGTQGGRCEAHAVQRARSIDQHRRAGRGPRKYDLRSWRDGTRPAHLRYEPLCRECKVQHGWLIPATEVDHIDGDNTNDDPSNLQSLCKPCHSRKTVEEQGALALHRRG
jgi:5-methylcytosine-specific restriction endonuclease McrA